MSGFSQALLEDHAANLPTAAQEDLQEIIVASRHMGELVEGLLRLSRSTRGELQRDPVDLSAMASRLLQDLASGAADRQVDWIVQPGLFARGDARMIEVVLANLLGNAWKYTARTAHPKIQVCSQGIGVEQSFCVIDNGAGFDVRHSVKLFQPFQRLHRQDEFPGLGIGLATVQRIIHRHGGTIQATAVPGQGATFRFTLPGSAGGEGKQL
jgi:signal transduction histidine kinase